jgi:hypothetical protein
MSVGLATQVTCQPGYSLEAADRAKILASRAARGAFKQIISQIPPTLILLWLYLRSN